MDLKDNSTIPVTDEQVEAFAIWVKNRYGGRGDFEIALRNKDRRAIEYYFTHTIFSEEQCQAWLKSEPFVGKTSENPHTVRLQLYRRRLEIKITRTSTDLIRRAFPISDDNTAATQLQHTNRLRIEHYWQYQGRVPRCTVLHKLDTTEIAAHIPSGCGICLSTHAMLDSCVTNCGHEFGAKCFWEWDYKTCPTCSEFCHELTEFVCSSRSVDF